jgi:hypothetical protein
MVVQPVVEPPAPVEEVELVESSPEVEIEKVEPVTVETEMELEEVLFAFVLQEETLLFESEPESMEEEPELIVPVTMEPVEEPPCPVEDVHVVQSPPEPDILEFDSRLIETSIALEEHFFCIEEAVELVASDQEEPVVEMPVTAVPVAEPPQPVQSVRIVESLDVPEVFVSTPVVTESVVVDEYFVYAQQQETTYVTSASEQQVTVAPKPLMPQMETREVPPPVQMVREVESAPTPDVVEDAPEVAESETEVTELLVVHVQEEEIVVADVESHSEEEVVAVEEPVVEVAVQPEGEQPEQEQPEEIVYLQGQIESKSAQLVVVFDQVAQTASVATIPKPEKPQVVEPLTVPEAKVEEAQPVPPTEVVDVPVEFAATEERSEQIENVVESHVSQPVEDVVPAVVSRQVEEVPAAVVVTQKVEDFVPPKRKLVVPPETVEVTKKRKMLVEANYFGQSYERVERIGQLPVQQIEMEESPVEPVIVQQVEQVPVEDRPVKQIEQVPVESIEVEELEEVELVVEEEEIQVEEFVYEDTEEEVELEQQVEAETLELAVRHSTNRTNSIQLILIFCRLKRRKRLPAASRKKKWTWWCPSALPCRFRSSTKVAASPGMSANRLLLRKW